MRNISVNREEKYTKGKDTDYNRNVYRWTRKRKQDIRIWDDGRS